jgi:phosphoglycolate phosphatase
MYQYILFDLDGTITDSREGITKSVQYALKTVDIYEPDLSKLERFIGPPLRDSFCGFYGDVINETNVEEVVASYRKHFEPKGIFQNKVYEGIPELLKKLKANGKKLALASSKPEVFVRRILEYFSLEEYFDVIVGSLLDGTRENKSEIVSEALNQLFSTLPELENTVMVGDRKFDIEGAKAQKVTSIGVNYGFADPGELEGVGADFIANTVLELEEILLKENL